MTGHPLQRYAEAIAAVGARRLQDLPQSEPTCAIAGIVTGLRPLKTKRGDRMAVFMLEDEVGQGRDRRVPGGLSADSAPSSPTTRCCSCAASTSATTSRAGCVVREITPLEFVREKAVRGVEIRLAGKGLARPVMRELANVLDRHPGDRRVSVVVEVNGGARLRVRAATARRISPSDSFVKDVEAVCGTGTVVLK